MHVEFRISGMERMCAFDTESFIRMHQLMERRNQDSTPGAISLVDLKGKGHDNSARFYPGIKVQFVFENLISIETTDAVATLERHQHEIQSKNNWGTSEIRTKRYRCFFGEAILASLPSFVAERDLKIRILQVAPELNKKEAAAVRAVYPSYFQKSDPTLCIGVAKITLHELLITNSGVSVTLQPKQNMMSAVEARNLDTVVTNAMFGKDVGGSAVLTFQAACFKFNPKSLTSLLSSTKNAFNEGDITVPNQLIRVNGELTLVERMDGSERDRSDMNRVEELGAQMSTVAVRFVLVPYVVLIDRLLSLSEAVSWRHPCRTLLLLIIVFILLIADLTAMGLAIFIIIECIATLRMGIVFNSIEPHTARAASDVLESPATTMQDRFRSVLYGGHNTTLNSMIRARLFFAQGMQVDCYLELAFIAHRLRRMRQSLFPSFGVFIAGLVLFSSETLLLFAVLFIFFVYPIHLHLALSRFRRKWSQQLASGTLWKALTLCRPMHVTRVVHVACAVDPRAPRFGHSSMVPWCTPMASFSKLPHSPSLQAVAAPAEDTRPRLSVSMERWGLPGIGQSVAAASAARPVPNHSHHAPGEDAPRLGEHTVSFPFFNGATDGGNAGSLRNSIRSVPFPNAAISQAQVPWPYAEAPRFDFPPKPTPPLFFAVVVIVANSSADTAATGGGGSSTLTARTHTRGAMNEGTVQMAHRLRRLFQRTKALERPPQAANMREQYKMYFNSVFAFLQVVRRQCSLEIYVAPPQSQQMGGASSTPTSVLKLDQLVRAPWLVEKGEDDGITSTLLAHSFQQVTIGKLQPLHHFDNSARAFSLLAAYLLQGTRLSLYTGAGSRGCSVVLPLRLGTLDIEAAPEPNPCPPSLLRALEGFWKGWTEVATPIEINTDVVLKIIATHKEAWSADAASTPDYKHILNKPPEDQETARKTSKRLLQTFSAVNFFRPRQASQPQLQPQQSFQPLAPPSQPKQEHQQQPSLMSPSTETNPSPSQQLDLEFSGMPSGTLPPSRHTRLSLNMDSPPQPIQSVNYHRPINSWAYPSSGLRPTWDGRSGIVRIPSSTFDMVNIGERQMGLKKDNTDPPFLGYTKAGSNVSKDGTSPK